MSHPLCCGTTPALQRSLTFPDWSHPDDVLRASRVRLSPGGKATNAARAIVQASGSASLLTFIGGANGQALLDLMSGEGYELLTVETEAETRVCQTLLDEKQGRIRELVEEAPPVSPREWTELFARFEQALFFHNAACLCGSLPSGSPPDVLATLASIAADHRRLLVLDLKGPPLLQALPHAPALVKINAAELQETTGEPDIPRGIHALQSAGALAVLITDGPRPAWLHDGKRLFQLPLPAITPVNPIGGGDTVTGLCTLRLSEGRPVLEAAVAGLAAALAQAETDMPAVFDPARAREYAKRIRPA